MGRFEIPDFDKISGVFEPIPAGIYKVQVSKCEDRVGKQKGTKYLNWTLTVTADHPQYSGRNLWLATMLEPREALFKLKNLCEAVGGGFDATGVDTDRILGSELKVQVALRTNPENGVVSNEVVKCLKA